MPFALSQRHTAGVWRGRTLIQSCGSWIILAGGPEDALGRCWSWVEDADAEA